MQLRFLQLQHHLRQSLHQTNSYSVSSIPNTPTFPFEWDGIGTHKINASADDVWSPILNLPFNFCFYGTSYNQLLIGSNGVVTFDLNLAIDNCPWSFSTTIPNTTFPIKNAIYGVYQDTDIRDIASGGTITNSAIQNVNFYTLDTGLYAAPNRVYNVGQTYLVQDKSGKLYNLTVTNLLENGIEVTGTLKESPIGMSSSTTSNTVVPSTGSQSTATTSNTAGATPSVVTVKPFNTVNEIKNFQDWLDATYPTWLRNGKLNKSAGYGNYGTNTENAYKTYGSIYTNYLSTKGMSQSTP